MNELRMLLMIAALGAAGALARYLLSDLAYRSLGSDFPYGTLAVNVLGCFLLGALTHIGLATDSIPDSWRVSLGVGLLGGLTTFSTFGYETFRHLEDGNWLMAAGNVAANVVIGLAAVWLGVAAGRLLVGGA